MPVSVHESPARARAAALSDGALALALVRVPPDAAPLVVALGLASVAELPDAGGHRSLHLDSLRPRRGAHAGEPAALLVAPEDDIPVFIDRLHRAMATAGLAQQRVRITSSAAAAAAEVLAGAGLLLCDGPFARRHGLAWTALADAGLHRGYELAGAPKKKAEGTARPRRTSPWIWLVTRLGAAVGQSVVASRSARSRPSDDLPGDDSRFRLTVRALPPSA